MTSNMKIEKHKVEKIGQRWVLYNPQLMSSLKEDYFNCSTMKTNGMLIGSADGRGETCFFKTGDGIWALRHYLRGGLIAKFIFDKYLGFRLKNTRAWKEWHLLDQMIKLGLPVPTPVAASVIKSTLFYSADLITVYIENTQTLADVLEAKGLDNNSWVEIGRCIRRFHDHAVFHSDLNAKNIMLDDKNKIYLIDFDQCKFRKGNDWKQDNLLRLKRSLDKFSSKSESFNYDGGNWDSLLFGYNKR